MSNHLTFTTTLDTDTLTPLDYTVEGVLMVDNEETHIGFTSANFDRVFEELSYWTKSIRSVNVTYKTTAYELKGE
jgi:hypothetical protein